MTTPQPMSWAAALDEIVARVPPGRTCLVGVDGLGGSGKTSFAAALAERMADAVVVHVDDFQGEGITEWDWGRFGREVVTPLRDGQPARYTVWSWGEPAPDGVVDLAPGRPVVVEGVSATRVEADVPWTVTVWMDAPQAVRRQRVLDRDGPDVQRIWQEHWIGTEEAYAQSQRPWERVDLVVDGTGGLGQWTGS